MAAQYLAECWSDLTAGREKEREMLLSKNKRYRLPKFGNLCLTHQKLQYTVRDRYLGCSPINPAFAIGVNIEQNQTLHQVREDQLRAEDTETQVRLVYLNEKTLVRAH